MRRPLKTRPGVWRCRLSRGAVRQRNAVGGRHAAEVVALHRTGEALADGRARDIHGLAFLEHVGLELGAGGDFRLVLSTEAELDQGLARGDVRAGVMAVQRLGIQLGPARTERDLHGAVAVLLLILDLRDPVRKNLDHGHWHSFTGVGEHARHAGLAADQSDCHVYPLVLGPLRLASRDSLPKS